MATPQQVVPIPTEDEKTLAMVACVLSIFAGFIAPLAIWLSKKDSKFVSFHALQMLFFDLAYMLAFFALFFTIAPSLLGETNRPGFPATAPPEFPLKVLGVAWGSQLPNLAVSIFLGVKAKKGAWVRLPLLGNWARRAAGLPVL